eukprot:CAMPEP_0170069836 /NCGR_PEP_ID=MMETSP0019_2-20121128/8359_1 /TAXON_ID=98059 /ORGANISM="Dinobryon sp., Strain UTEXLB2267" /LENGTH=540 /DNA_ID=CAMNT_0010277975 /DNA_START=1006 /DNA_END=2625 /DNA_ORIENTATION=+
MSFNKKKRDDHFHDHQLLQENNRSTSRFHPKILTDKSPMAGTIELAGVGITFGNSSSLSALTVVPQSRYSYVGYVNDGSLIYGLSFDTPLDICPSTSSNIQYASIPVQTYALTSTQLLSKPTYTFINVVCGDPPPADSVNSVVKTTASAESSGLTANDCNNGEVAGADTPVTRFFTMGATLQKFTFSYQTFTVRDQIRVFNGNNLIFDSGCVGEMATKTLTMNDPKSKVIRVSVNPNCGCGDPVICTGTLWNFQVKCAVPTILSGGKVVGVGEIKPSGIPTKECAVATMATSQNTLYITSDGVMPDIQAQSAVSAKWSIQFCYTGTHASAGHLNPTYSQTVTGTSTEGSNWNVVSALQGNVIGGTAIATAVLSGQSYTIVFYIRGTNPSPGTIQAYANSIGNVPWYFMAMIAQESNTLNFRTSDRLPLQSYDNGFGLMQLTNSPVPDYNSIFNWKKNVKVGLQKIHDNEIAAAGWISRQRSQCQQDLGVLCPHIPTRNDVKCVFSDQMGATETFINAVAIKRYNGATANYVSWDNKNRVW